MRARVLDKAEWDGKAPLSLAPFLEHLDPAEVDIIVVEDGEKIVACVGVMNILHVDGAWISSEHSGNPGVARALLRLLTKVLLIRARGWVLAASDHPTVIKAMAKMDAIPLHTSPETRGFAFDVTKGASLWPLSRLKEETWV